MEDFGHVRPGYTLSSFKKLADKNGLKITKFGGYTYFFGKIAWRINDKSLKIPPIAALLFYPVYSLTYLDLLRIGKPNGLFFVASKINN